VFGVAAQDRPRSAVALVCQLCTLCVHVQKTLARVIGLDYRPARARIIPKGAFSKE
jgi:hypothetical protein